MEDDRPLRDIGYTSVLKIMQIMRDKGLFGLRRPQPAAGLSPPPIAAGDPQTPGRGSLKRAFGGSARSLLLHALGNERTSRDELDEIRKLLDEMEGKAK